MRSRQDVYPYRPSIYRALMQQQFRHFRRIHFCELRADRREIQALFRALPCLSRRAPGPTDGMWTGCRAWRGVAAASHVQGNSKRVHAQGQPMRVMIIAGTLRFRPCNSLYVCGNTYLLCMHAGRRHLRRMQESWAFTCAAVRGAYLYVLESY